MSDVTRILSEIEEGDSLAAKRLLPLVYDELRKLAAAKLVQEKPGQTLQATALVHEAYAAAGGVDVSPRVGCVRVKHFPSGSRPSDQRESMRDSIGPGGKQVKRAKLYPAVGSRTD